MAMRMYMLAATNGSGRLRQSIGGMTTDAARRDAGKITEHRRLVRSAGDGIGERVEITVHAHALLLKLEWQFGHDDGIDIGGHAHARGARRLLHDFRIARRQAGDEIMHGLQQLTHLTEDEITLRWRQVNRGALVGCLARPAAHEEIAQRRCCDEPKNKSYKADSLLHLFGL